MACFSPLLGYKKANGGLTFSRKNSTGQTMSVPCGQCIGCRIKKSRDWAIRCIHEASLHTENSFITLTYNNQNLPKHAELKKIHFQKFIRALRKQTKKKIRYFQCGEYGKATPENNEIARPHYHAILFGHEWPDRVFHSERNNKKLYTSQLLTDLWGKGFASTGSVTIESAGYVARYALKKITGKGAADHYLRCDPETGEAFWLQPEYNTMSLKPGIGYEWFKQFKNDVFPEDFVIIKGKKQPTPKYYTSLLAKVDPKEYEQIKSARLKTMEANKHDNTWQRMEAKEKCTIARTSKLIRPIT